MAEVDEGMARQARNEALFREVNERIEQLGKDAPDGIIDVLCECGRNGGCGERISVPFDVYEHVRQQDDRFVIVPGHETPAIERVVERSEHYLVVDKIRAVEPQVEDDPRGAPSS